MGGEALSHLPLDYRDKHGKNQVITTKTNGGIVEAVKSACQ